MIKLTILGDGRMAFHAPHPSKLNLPYTIATMLEQMGGFQITGALCYIGADQKQLKWKCKDVDHEYRGTTSLHGNGVTEHNTHPLDLKLAVGIQFPVNGKDDEGWHMAVTYEGNDTYKVWLYQTTPHYEVIDTREDVYGEDLQHIVESMYDRAIKNRNHGFINLH